jgi:Phage conserved hypothetical protein BR0599
MSYVSVDESRQSGLPIEAYEFVGTYETYRYVNSDRRIQFFGNWYEPIPINRDEAVYGDQAQDGVEMTLELPVTAQLIVDYAFNIAPPDLDLTVYRCHIGLDFAVDPIVFWQGPVTGFNVEKDIAKVRIPSILENVFSGNMPNFYYQQSCNHTLYGSLCGLAESSFRVNALVTAINGQLITVDDDGYADNFLKAGMIRIIGSNERRLILSNVANVLTIFMPFSNLLVGETIQLVVGCDHTFTTCKAKFSNGRNFGGFPYIPTDNPFQGEL